MVKLSELIIIGFFCILLSTTVMAADMLNIKDIRVEVDDDKQSANEGGGTVKIVPDSKLTLKVEVENLYESGTDGGEIEDIEVLVVLEDIDDGDDLEEEADSFDLRPGRDKTVTINFDIPLRLETDETFIMILEVEGEDKNGTIHTASIEFDVDVDKENHEIRFIKKELLPDKVSCSRSSTVRVELINTGDNDEDDVELTITSSELGYNKRVTFDMSENIDDDENEYSFSDSIDLEDVTPGTYTVMVHVEYNKGKDKLDIALPLVVNQCGTSTPVPAPTPVSAPVPVPTPTPKPTPSTPTVAETVEVISAPASSYVRPSQLVATPKTNYNQSWWDENKWITIILVTDLVLVIAGILVIMMVLRRRRR